MKDFPTRACARTLERVRAGLSWLRSRIASTHRGPVHPDASPASRSAYSLLLEPTLFRFPR